MIFVKSKCRKCKQQRKFCYGTPRWDKRICGDCWDWTCPAGKVLNDASKEYAKLINSSKT